MFVVEQFKEYVNYNENFKRKRPFKKAKKVNNLHWNAEISEIKQRNNSSLESVDCFQRSVFSPNPQAHQTAWSGRKGN